MILLTLMCQGLLCIERAMEEAYDRSTAFTLSSDRSLVVGSPRSDRKAVAVHCRSQEGLGTRRDGPTLPVGESLVDGCFLSYER
jgi:hypothetical protein